MAKPLLMPKATAVWLVDNTSLSFDQIAEFCGLHPLEVKGIADGDVAQGIRGLDPITSGQVTREEIERGQTDPSYRLKLAEPKVEIPEVKTRKGPRYTPLSRRQDRPNAILWLLRNHSELKDSQIIRLVGTTKPTIQAIRDRTHWNSPNLQPQDPVTLGLCSQIDLDAEVQKAARRLEREGKTAEAEGRAPETLLPTAETIAATGAEPATEPELAPEPEPEEAEEEELDADSVFAKLKALKEPAGEEAEPAGEAEKTDQTED
ncbi:MAG TPA: cell cycle transcriptional regulator TrcR [Hyphomicrobiales bacterium]|nr:cell cycle transcriptional regulator TrcR [Hyphomicrobiales bacterium]